MARRTKRIQRPQRFLTGRHRTYVAVGWLVVLAAALRAHALDAQPLWWDEGYSVFFATEPLPRLVELTSLDIHPPLYYVLLKGWFALAGIGAIQARLLSVMLGVLAVPLMWRVARRLFGWDDALLATTLLTTAPFHIYYSQEVRMYALFVLLTLLAVSALLEWGATGRPVWGVVLTGASIALLYTQYYAAFVLAAIVLMWAWWRWHDPHVPPLHHMGMVLVGSLLAYAPWVFYAAPRLSTYVRSKVAIEADTPLTPSLFLWRHVRTFALGHLMPQQEWLAPAAAVVLGFVLVGIVYGWRTHRHQTGFLLIWFGTPFVGVFIVNLLAPFTDPRIERQLLPVLPAYLMLAVLGIQAMWRFATRPGVEPRRAITGATGMLMIPTLAVAVSLSGFYTIPRYADEDYRPLLAHIAAHQTDGDAYLWTYPWQAGYLRAYVPHRRLTSVEIPLAWADDVAARRDGVQRLYEQYTRIWFPAYQVKGRILEERLAETLHATGVYVWDDWYGNTRLWLMARAPDAPPQRVDLTFAEGVRLTTLATSSPQVASGVGVFSMLLGFETRETALRAVIKAMDDRGGVWGEMDVPVETPLTRVGLQIAPGTPPGLYYIELRLYRADDGRTLDVLDAQGAPVAPTWRLADIEVVRPPHAIPAEAVAATQWYRIPLGDAVELVGADVFTGTVRTGDLLPLTLYWRAQRDLAREYWVFVQAFAPTGELRAARDLPPVDGTFPTTRWRAGDLVRDPHILRIPATGPAGEWVLYAGLYDRETGTRLTTPDGADAIVLGRFTVEERPHTFTPPDDVETLNVLFGETVALYGAKIAWPRTDTRLQPGDTLPITLVWQPRRTPEQRLHTFVQLLDAQNHLLAVSDHEPPTPSSAWVADEFITDEHHLTLPPTLPAGTYRLVVGVYDAESGHRLLLPNGHDMFEIARVQVESP
nr:glycosyltransferase family 39 protein [Ardenticatena sp.]